MWPREAEDRTADPALSLSHSRPTKLSTNIIKTLKEEFREEVFTSYFILRLWLHMSFQFDFCHQIMQDALTVEAARSTIYSCQQCDSISQIKCQSGLACIEFGF